MMTLGRQKIEERIGRHIQTDLLPLPGDVLRWRCGEAETDE